MLSMSLLPCCRYHPAGIRQTYNGQFSFAYAAFTSKLQALASRALFDYGPPMRLLTLRPGNLLITPMVILSMGFRRFGYPTLCHSSYRASASTLTGLTPAEHTSLSWTHNLVLNFTPLLGRLVSFAVAQVGWA